jgi:hypothetical protein
LLYSEPKKQQKKNNFLTICKMGAFFCGDFAVYQAWKQAQQTPEANPQRL